ncbi:MAG: DUF433 domain-containing protein [Acidobacteria bacterium]|nr:DUF433 domain-containing protein [Acidobacteriota bacterium]
MVLHHRSERCESRRAAAHRRHRHIDAGIQGGRPVINGTRVPVARIVASLSAGADHQELMDDYGLRAMISVRRSHTRPRRWRRSRFTPGRPPEWLESCSTRIFPHR